MESPKGQFITVGWITGVLMLVVLGLATAWASDTNKKVSKIPALEAGYKAVIQRLDSSDIRQMRMEDKLDKLIEFELRRGQ